MTVGVGQGPGVTSTTTGKWSEITFPSNESVSTPKRRTDRPSPMKTWSMATPCIVCEEFCPTSPKAIWVEEADVPRRLPIASENGGDPKMESVHVQRPHVDPSLCIGCGACEKVCPVQDKPAVYVTSVGESRSKTNVILLENTDYNKS